MNSAPERHGQYLSVDAAKGQNQDQRTSNHSGSKVNGGTRSPSYYSEQDSSANNS